MTYTEGGVVCTRDGGVSLSGVEDIAEVSGAGSHAAVDDDIVFHVEGRHGFL